MDRKGNQNPNSIQGTLKASPSAPEQRQQTKPFAAGWRGSWPTLAVVGVTLIVIAIYGLIAFTADSELGSRTAAEAYYNRLADGLIKGEPWLDLEPPKGLVSLPDPYDRVANSEFRGKMYAPGRLHDLSYFKGRLYLYFSVVPAVLLFIPYHALTGGYLTHQEACFVFSSLGFIASVILVALIRSRCFPRASIASAIPATFCIGLVPVIPIVLQRPDVWEIPITASYALWMASLLALWRYLSRPPASWGTISVLSLAVGLAIGCRPNSLIGAAILGVPLYRMLRQLLGGLRTRACYAALAALIVPIAAVGICLAAFNHWRFGSIFEFGQKYQLNENVAVYSGYFRPSFFWYDFRLYFLEYPGWQPTFPYVKSLTVPTPPIGYGGVFGPVGVLTLMPFTLIALAVPVGFRSGIAQQRKLLAIIVGAIAVIFVANAGPLCFFFGAGIRYQMEFVPALVLLAIIGVFALEARFAADTPAGLSVRSLVYLFACASLAFNLLMTIALRSRTLSYRGNNAMDSRQWKAASEFYKRALRLTPSEIHTMLSLGRSYIEEGRMADACEEFGRVVSLYPDSPEAHLNYAFGLFQVRLFDEATAECEAALRLKPDLVAAKNGLQQIRAEQGGRH